MAAIPLFLIQSICDIMHLSERSKRAVDIRGRFEQAFTEGCLMEAHIINIMRLGICILTLAVDMVKYTPIQKCQNRLIVA